MKVNTVEQFKILKFLEENFEMDKITLELHSPKCIKVTDQKGEDGYFEYQDGKVVLMPF